MLFREFVIYIGLLGPKCGSRLDQKWQKRMFSYQPPITNTVFSSNKFPNSLNLLPVFFIILEFFCQKYRLPYSQCNILISLTSQVLIGPYLIHSVHAPPLLSARGTVNPGGDLFQGFAAFT